MNHKRQQAVERWQRKQSLLDAHAETWESFRRLISRIFAARLAERGDEPLLRRPPWSMRLTAAGDPPAYLAVRPRYDAPPRWTGKPGTLSPEELEVELMVGRMKDRNEDRYAFGYELRATLRPGAATCRRYSIAFGDEAIERAASVAKDFVADPAQLLALSSDHCCLCGRGLTDEQSRSRGVGPECVRFLNSLVGTVSDRKAQAVFVRWMAEAAAT